jgi:periplasmic protein TonB
MTTELEQIQVSRPGDEATSATSTTSEKPERVEKTLPFVAVYEENLAALVRSPANLRDLPALGPEEEAKTRFPLVTAHEQTEAAQPQLKAGPAELETFPARGADATLALIAAIQNHRAALAHPSRLTEATERQPIERPKITSPRVASDENHAVIWPLRPGSDESSTVEPPETAAPTLMATQESRSVLLRENTPASGMSPMPEAEPAGTKLRWVGENKEQRPGRAEPSLWIYGAVLALVAVSADVVRNYSSSEAKPNVPVAAANFPLRLQAEPHGKGLIDVRWNPGGAVAQAREGRLVITEPGQQPRIVALEPQQLTTGYLSYQSSTERVEFQLEVVDRSGASIKESISRILSGAEAAPLAGTSLQSGQGQSPTTKAPPASPIESKSDTPQVATVLVIPQANRPQPRPFTPPPLQSRRQEVHAISLDPPVLLPGGPAIPPGVVSPGVFPSGVILPGTANSIAAPRGNPVTRQIKVGGNLQAANLIRKVMPIYPALAKSARLQGTVRFTATIGRDGTVRDLQVMSGPSILDQPAIDAVKQWLYRPTLLNGEPIEVITQIDVNFSLNQ